VLQIKKCFQNYFQKPHTHNLIFIHSFIVNFSSLLLCSLKAEQIFIFGAATQMEVNTSHVCAQVKKMLKKSIVPPDEHKRVLFMLEKQIQEGWRHRCNTVGDSDVTKAHVIDLKKLEGNTLSCVRSEFANFDFHSSSYFPFLSGEYAGLTLVEYLAKVSPLQACGALHAVIYSSSQTKDEDVMKDTPKLVLVFPMMPSSGGLGIISTKAFKATTRGKKSGGCKITTSSSRRVSLAQPFR
jgi:hypothetical protein